MCEAWPSGPHILDIARQSIDCVTLSWPFADLSRQVRLLFAVYMVVLLSVVLVAAITTHTEKTGFVVVGQLCPCMHVHVSCFDTDSFFFV